MKKLIVIPVMFLYMLAATGIMIHAHYCGQELESWQMYVNNEDGCKDDVCTDVAEEEEGCCKDEVVVTKISNDQDVVSFFKLKLASAEWILPGAIQPFYSAQSVTYELPAIITGHPNAPPGLWQQIPLFKLHSRFTYYG